MSEIAKDVGVKSAAVHWYFPTKEDLFAAAFDNAMRVGYDAVASAEIPDSSPQKQVVHFLIDRSGHRQLHFDAHDLADHCEQIADTHNQMHIWLGDRLQRAVQQRLPKDVDLDLTDAIGHVLLEGLLNTKRLDHDIEEIIEFSIDALSLATKKHHNKSKRPPH